MWEFFLSALTLKNVLIMLAGLVAGVIVGALPGFTPTMGVAILVPFTFAMDPLDALVLLGAVYTGSVYGGSITAILLNIPGAPANIGTTFDGYPMAKRGEGQRALFIAVWTSIVGGIIGMLSLLFFAPPLADLALRFGPAETFWVCVFGMTVIAGLASGSLLKGLLSGAYGILLSTIGTNPVTGMSRLTFGSDYLLAGIGVVAALIGLFALSQAVSYVEESMRPRGVTRLTLHWRAHVVWQSLLDALKCVRAWTIGGVIGTIVGILPGAGGQIASLVAYDQVKRFSPPHTREKFGSGIPEGIVASETSNNAMVGGSLVPTLTLGIPGSPTAAVLLGALTMHGLWAGYELFVKHTELVYTFIASLFYCQLLLIVAAYICIRFFTSVVNVPYHLLATAIVTLCVFGAYATNNSPAEVIQMLWIGLLAYLGLKLGFSPAPAVLGLILGHLMENGFLLARRIAIAKGTGILYFFSSPISIILIALSILSVATLLFQERRSRRKTAAQITTAPKAEARAAVPSGSDVPTSGLKMWQYNVIAGIVIILASLVLMIAGGLGRSQLEDVLFPTVIEASMIVLAGLLVLNELVRPAARSHAVVFANYPTRQALLVVAGIIAYAYLAIHVGFYLATLAFLLLAPLGISQQAKFRFLKETVPFAIGLTVFLYLTFSQLLRVPMPANLLF